MKWHSALWFVKCPSNIRDHFNGALYCILIYRAWNSLSTYRFWISRRLQSTRWYRSFKGIRLAKWSSAPHVNAIILDALIAALIILDKLCFNIFAIFYCIVLLVFFLYYHWKIRFFLNVYLLMSDFIKPYFFSLLSYIFTINFYIFIEFLILI